MKAKFYATMKSLIIFLFFLNAFYCKAQDSSKTNKPMYYRLSLGAGIGWGLPQQEANSGLAGMIEFAVQRQSTVYSFGTRGITEVNLFSGDNINTGVYSFDLTCGKIFQSNSFFCSASGGIGLVSTQERGRLIAEGSGWFGIDTYEKLTRHTIGLPLSAKVIYMPASVYGFGAEFYANNNSRSSFYGVNFLHQFGKLREARNKKRKK